MRLAANKTWFSYPNQDLFFPVDLKHENSGRILKGIQWGDIE